MSGRGDARAQSGGGALGAGGGAEPPGRPGHHDDEDAIRAHAAADPKAGKRLLKGLTLTGDDSTVLASLSQLCDMITYSSDEGLLMSGFSGGAYIPDLVRLLSSMDGSIQLMSSKILTQCFDQVPGTIGVAVQAGVVEALCEKLLCIEYIDVAEQAISALDKIAVSYPRSILSCGGLNAILCFLDFFSLSIQRVAVRAVATACRSVPADLEQPVLDAAHVLVNLMGQGDGRMVESAAQAIVRILEGFERNGGEEAELSLKLEEVASHGLVSQATQLLSTALPENASAQLVEMTPTLTELLLHMLALLARHSLPCCSDMMDLGLPSILHGLLVEEAGDALAPSSSDPTPSSPWGTSGGGGSWKEGSTPTQRRRSRSIGGAPPSLTGGDVMVRVLVLLDELLPPLPLQYHPLARQAGVATTGASPSSATRTGPMSRHRVEDCLLHVTHPRGAVCSPDLEVGPSGRMSSSSAAAVAGRAGGVRVEVGTLLASSEQVTQGSGIVRYRTPLGWVSDRTYGTESEPLCQPLRRSEESASAKHALLLEREGLHGPLLSLLLPCLVDLHQSASSGPVQSLCRSVLLKCLHCLPADLLTPCLAEPSMVPRLSSLVARLASWKAGQGLATHTGLLLGLLLLDKSPGVYGEALQREGMLAAAHFHLHHADDMDHRPTTGGSSQEPSVSSSSCPVSPLTIPPSLASPPPPHRGFMDFASPRSLGGGSSSMAFSRSPRPSSFTGRDRSGSDMYAAAAAAVVDAATRDELLATARSLLEKTGPAGVGNAMAWLPSPSEAGAPAPGVLGVLQSLGQTLAGSGREETLATLKAAATLCDRPGACSSPTVTLETCRSAWQRRGGEEAGKSCEAALTTLCTLLGSSKGISNYELLSSGILARLVAYLTASEADAPAQGEGKAMVVEVQLRRLRRHRARLFSTIFYLRNPSSSSSPASSPVLGPAGSSSSTSSSSSCMQRLLTQLQSCLSASDAFPLELSTGLGGLAGPSGSSAKGVLAQLSQPLKLKVKCLSAQNDPALHAYLHSRGMLSFSILMEPLASVTSLRDFLERRLHQAPPPPASGVPPGAGSSTQQQSEGRARKKADEQEGEEAGGYEEVERREKAALRRMARGQSGTSTSTSSDGGGEMEEEHEDEDMDEEDEDEEEEEGFEMAEDDDASSYSGEDDDKENVDVLVPPHRTSSTDSSASSSSSSAGSGASTTAPTATSSSSSPGLGTKLLQKAGRLVGVSGSSSGEADECGGKKPAASYSPWDRYRPGGLSLVINDAAPSTEDGPVLEAIFLGLARRVPPSELWGTTHVVGWSLAEKDAGPSPPVVSSEAASGGKQQSTGSPSCKGSSSSSKSAGGASGGKKGGRAASAAGGSGEASHAAPQDLLPLWWSSHPVDTYLTPSPALPEDEADSSDEYDVLCALRLLYGLNRHAASLFGPVEASRGEITGRVLREEAWVNRTLSERVSVQLKDPLVLITKAMPRWCERLMDLCPFLLPFSVRKEWLYATAFGIPRALHSLATREAGAVGGSGGGPSRSGGGGGHGSTARAAAAALQHLKVRVSRQHLLRSAEKVLEECAKRGRVLLETEYQDEPGTGSGPTAEFFSLVSQELRKASLGLWRKSGIDGAALGLFPRPHVTKPATGSEGLQRFRCLGRLLGQALLDERLLDIRLAPPLVAALAGQQLCQSLPAALDELGAIDAELGRQVAQLVTLCGMSTGGEGLTGQGADRQTVDDLCLGFTLPGYDRVHLLPKGDQEAVTSDRLALYIQRLLSVSLVEAVQDEVRALTDGFHDIVPPGAIARFTVDEVVSMLGGAENEFGTYEDILDAIACDHGYSRGSRAVQWLVEILAEMSAEEQRRFLMFVTGCPCLPVGGLRACTPRLTVVKKVLEGHHRSLGQAAVDSMLPSASTCTNYMKIPDYSSKAIMRDRLLFSIHHGQHSFHLS